MSTTCGIYPLASEHAEAIQRLAADPRVAATSSIPHPYPEHGARHFVAQQLEDRAAGTAWVFAIMDRAELVGVCGVEGLGRGDAPEIGYWIGAPYWGRGYATFGVRMLLEFVFNNLGLDSVAARSLEGNPASVRVLEKNGFRRIGVRPNTDAGLHTVGEPVVHLNISRAGWQAHRNGPAVEQ